jgi:tetrahydromethanopterin S-methyltransferase subunit E
MGVIKNPAAAKCAFLTDAKLGAPFSMLTLLALVAGLAVGAIVGAKNAAKVLAAIASIKSKLSRK